MEQAEIDLMVSDVTACNRIYVAMGRVLAESNKFFSRFFSSRLRDEYRAAKANLRFELNQAKWQTNFSPACPRMTLKLVVNALGMGEDVLKRF